MGDAHCIRLRRLPSEGRNEAPTGYEGTRKAFFEKFREVASKKQSDPDENVSSIEEVCKVLEHICRNVVRWRYSGE